MKNVTLAQAALVATVASVLLAVIIPLMNREEPTLNKEVPTEVVVKVTRSNVPANDVCFRLPDGTTRSGDKGIFHIPANWQGSKLILEDTTTATTLKTVVLETGAAAIVEIEVD